MTMMTLIMDGDDDDAVDDGDDDGDDDDDDDDDGVPTGRLGYRTFVRLSVVCLVCRSLARTLVVRLT